MKMTSTKLTVVLTLSSYWFSFNIIVSNIKRGEESENSFGDFFKCCRLIGIKNTFAG